MPDLSAVPQTENSDTSTTVEEVGTEAAREAWAEAGRAVLLRGSTGRYQAVISHKDLAQQVQERTGITTSRLVHYWIADVLGPVAIECATREEPLLVALCVNSQDSVGAAYANAVQAARGETPRTPRRTPPPSGSPATATSRPATFRPTAAARPSPRGWPPPATGPARSGSPSGPSPCARRATRRPRPPACATTATERRTPSRRR